MRRFNRSAKYDPLVDEGQLIEANSHYAFIRYPDGRESTVSLPDLAPRGSFELILFNNHWPPDIHDITERRSDENF